MPELGQKKEKEPDADLPPVPPVPPPSETAAPELDKKRLSTALMKISERSLAVDPRDVDGYVPREADLRIAEAMLAGSITFAQIGTQLGVAPQWVGNYMRDPLVCAWVSRTIHRNIQHRLGQVDAAMLQRAMAGDCRAADLLYKRYGQMTQRSVHLVGQLDFTKMADADLDALIKDAQKQQVIDISGQEAPDAGGDGGEEAP